MNSSDIFTVEQILKDYPKAPAALNVDIEKYLQRAKASEAK